MPELPEVFTIAKDLKEIEGYKVIFNRLIDDTVFKTPFYNLAGRIIEKVENHGKYIVIRFDKTAMIIHLAMAGQLFLDYGTEIIPSHCHWLIQIEDGKQIRFVDHRKFGKVFHFETYDECYDYIYSKIGPTPWGISPESFYLKLQQPKYRKKPIKQVIMRQELICGLGNIYAAEALFRAKYHPLTETGNLADNQAEHLLYAIRYVLDKGIENRGTSFSDYKTGKGTKGNNQNFLKVYKQKECQVCNNKISSIKLDGRNTWYCHKCQRIVGGKNEEN